LALPLQRQRFEDKRRNFQQTKRTHRQGGVQLYFQQSVNASQKRCFCTSLQTGINTKRPQASTVKNYCEAFFPSPDNTSTAENYSFLHWFLFVKKLTFGATKTESVLCHYNTCMTSGSSYTKKT
jgi:hypothetical protein